MHKVRPVNAHELFPIIEELLKDGSSARITVTGMSMMPFLHGNRDGVELTQTSFQEIGRGDIVLILEEDGSYILHRVLKKEKECFYLLGDALRGIEGPYRPGQLVAKVRTVIRKGREINCANFWWRFFSSLWRVITPARGMMAKLYRVYHRLLHR